MMNPNDVMVVVLKDIKKLNKLVNIDLKSLIANKIIWSYSNQ